MNDDVERLTTELDSTQREALGDLDELVDLLAAYDAPPDPGPQEHARLLAALDCHLPAPYLREAEPRWNLRAWLELAWSQARLLSAPFWWASGLVLLLGLATALLEGEGLLVLTFLFLTPVLAAAGVAYAFRPETRTLWELERLTAVNPLELLYVRLLLILACDTLLSLLLLGVAWLQVPQVVLWRLLLAWLGPMLALAGTALYATVRGGPTLGAVVPLGLWGAFLLVGWWQVVQRAVEVQHVPGWLLVQVNTSPRLPLVGLLSATAGLFLFWQAGRAVAGTT
jgi:hypothetical protein